MTRHAEDPLRRPRISQVLDLALAVPTPEAARAKCLVARKYSQVLDLLPTGAAAVCAVVADEGAIAEKEEVRIRVEE